MENVQKLREDVLEAEVKLMDQLIERVDVLSDEYIRMSLTQLKLAREIVRQSEMIEFHKKWPRDLLK